MTKTLFKAWLGALLLTVGLASIALPSELQVGPRRALLSSGYKAAYLCNYLNGAFCGGEAYSTTSLRTVVDATGAVTYAPNNKILQSNNFSSAPWAVQNGASISGNTVTFPSGGTAQLFQSITGPTGSYIISVIASSATGKHFKFAVYSDNEYVSSDIITTPTPTLYFWLYTGPLTVNMQILNGSDAASGSITLANMTFSAVTYETSPRPGDQVITTSAPYYGPAFDHTLGTGAPLGYRSEAAATNLYLNSSAPATQTITTALGTTYTGSIRQTGTQAFTGSFTASLTGVANTVVQTTQAAAVTTALVATDTGLAATAYPQVEAGSFATSPIITGALSVTRAADSVTLAGFLASLEVTNPIIVERQSEATGAISRTLYAKNTFAFATGYWYRQLVACPASEPTSRLNAVVAGSGALHC